MRNLKLPAPPRIEGVRLRDDEMFFLDLTLVTNELPGELYIRVFRSNESQLSGTRKASALMQSMNGKAYLSARKEQLEAYYFPDEAEFREANAKQSKGKTIEEAIADLQPDFIDELYATMRNRNDPNFADTFKLVLTKNLKDIQTDRLSEAPRRYLPESCNSCAYKKFVEENCIETDTESDVRE